MNAIDICNMALAYLNNGRINSLDEDSTAAKACRLHYDHLRRRLLRMYPWGFANKMDKLALLVDKAPGYAYAYAYPSDCICMRFVFDTEHADKVEEERQDFSIMQLGTNGRAILTDVALAYGIYTADIKQPEMFSEEFIDALAHLLASTMAMTLSGSTDLQNINLQLSQNAIDIARYQDAIEQERKTRYPHGYADARFQ